MSDLEPTSASVSKSEARNLLDALNGARERLLLDLGNWHTILWRIHDTGAHLALGWKSWAQFVDEQGIGRQASYRAVDHGEALAMLEAAGAKVRPSEVSDRAAAILVRNPEAAGEIAEQIEAGETPYRAVKAAARKLRPTPELSAPRTDRAVDAEAREVGSESPVRDRDADPPGAGHLGQTGVRPDQVPPGGEAAPWKHEHRSAAGSMAHTHIGVPEHKHSDDDGPAESCEPTPLLDKAGVTTLGAPSERAVLSILAGAGQGTEWTPQARADAVIKALVLVVETGDMDEAGPYMTAEQAETIRGGLDALLTAYDLAHPAPSRERHLAVAKPSPTPIIPRAAAPLGRQEVVTMFKSKGAKK